jgi:hypothetical protein
MMATTAGESRSWLALGGLTIGALAWQVACGTPPQEDQVLAEATTDLLASVGPYVVLPALAVFDDDVAALSDAVGVWKDALASGGDGGAERVAAQVFWVDVMSSWQCLEVM